MTFLIKNTLLEDLDKTKLEVNTEKINYWDNGNVWTKRYYTDDKLVFEVSYDFKVSGKINKMWNHTNGGLVQPKLKENDIVVFNDDPDNIPYLVHSVNNDTISVILGLEEYPDVPMDSEILFTKITKLSGKELFKARKQIQKLM